MTIGFGMRQPKKNQPRYGWYQKRKHRRIAKRSESKWWIDAYYTGVDAATAPIAVGTLSPWSFTKNTGPKTYNSAVGFSGLVTNYALVSPPTGFSINPTSGSIIADSSITAAGSPTLTIQASNAFGFATQTLATAIAIAAPITVGSLGTWTEVQSTGNKTFNAAVGFSGASITYSLPTGGTGYSINSSTGVVTVNTATAGVGTHPLVVRATNVSGSADQAISSVISSGLAAPVAVGTIGPWNVGQFSGSQTFNAAAGFTGASIVYTLQTGATGVSINSTTGLVTADTSTTGSGTKSLVVRATNGSGFADQPLSLVIAALSAPTTVGTIGPWNETTNTGSKTFNAATGFAGSSIVYSLVSPPAGVTIDSSTGVVTANTAVVAAGTTALSVKATNGAGNVTQALSLVLALPMPTVTPGTISGSLIIAATLSLASTVVTDATTTTYSWKINGVEVGTAATFSPDFGGSLTCTITGTNSTGSASATTPAVTIDPTPVCTLSGAALGASTAPTIVMPTPHKANDICFLLVETSNEPVATPAGYNALTAIGIGAAAGADSTLLAAFWKRAASSAEPDVVVADAGDHTYGRLHIIRGCPTVGTPVVLLSSLAANIVATPFNFPDANTPTNNALVFQGVARPQDIGGSGYAFTPSGLTNSVKLNDGGTTVANGGGFATNAGNKAVAGAIGVTSVVTSLALPQSMAMVNYAFLSTILGAPTLVGTIGPWNEGQNTGSKTFNASVGFAGSLITYSLVSPPTGVTIDSSTGVVTANTNVLTAGTKSLTVQATNASGNVTQPLSLIVAEQIKATGGTRNDFNSAGVDYVCLTLDATGNIDILVAGNYDLLYQASGGAGSSASTGSAIGGSGGAGGFLIRTAVALSVGTYTVTIGDPGIGAAPGGAAAGPNGGDLVAFGTTVVGGGSGGNGGSAVPNVGAVGGCGGGGAARATTNQPGGAGTAGQGLAGTSGWGSSVAGERSAGAGGSTFGAGAAAAVNKGGNAGAGTTSNFDGTSRVYGVGAAGGCGTTGVPGTPSPGGGTGSDAANVPVAGTAPGSGGYGVRQSIAAGSGIKGVFKLRYVKP